MDRILKPGCFYGDRQGAQQLPGIRLTENAYAPAFVIPRHAHQSAFFGMVIEGGYREHYDRRSRECTPDTLVFHPAGERHSEQHDDVVVRIFNVEPSRQLLERVQEYSGALDGPREFRAGSLLRLAARLYAEFRTNDPALRLPWKLSPWSCSRAFAAVLRWLPVELHFPPRVGAERPYHDINPGSSLATARPRKKAGRVINCPASKKSNSPHASSARSTSPAPFSPTSTCNAFGRFQRLCAGRWRPDRKSITGVGWSPSASP